MAFPLLKNRKPSTVKELGFGNLQKFNKNKGERNIAPFTFVFHDV